MVHILQADNDHNHVHDNGVKLSHTICIEDITEEKVQNEFDLADPKAVLWNIASVEFRHEICYEFSPENREGPTPNQISLTLLRSCRQIYLEAKTIPYTKNTFAVNCPDTFERFVKARLQKKQHLLIRSLYVEFMVYHTSSVDAWSDVIDGTLLKRLTSVRFLNLSLVQAYCKCSIGISGYKKSEMTDRLRKMFQKLGKLPLKEATLLVDDSLFWKSIESEAQADVEAMEEHFRWTMKQKQDFSKETREALLERGE